MNTPIRQSISVVGLGGAGTSALNLIIQNKPTNVDYYCLDNISLANKTNEDVIASIKKELEDTIATKNTKIVFIVTGQGGHFGTVYSPMFANFFREKGAFVIAVAIMPFCFENEKKRIVAENGLKELKKCADALITLSNDNLQQHFGKMPFNKAFELVDDFLLQLVKCTIILVNTNTKAIDCITSFFRDDGVKKITQQNIDNKNDTYISYYACLSKTAITKIIQ